ncbi:NAD-binding protein, partial [Klebsiella pneumoniae]
LASARQAGLVVCYGDAEDADFIAHLPLQQARALVSTIPQREVNALLLRAARSAGFRGSVTLSAFREGDLEAFTRAGAASILQPYIDAADSAARRLLQEMEQ